MKNKNLIYVAGPTGIGKTKLAIELAKKFNTEIVSCDSRQFYKELKIGTCPPSFDDLNDIKHHFIHNKSIKDTYSVGDYEKEAIDLISEIFKIKDTLILVGGSGLYADSILFGIDEFPNISKEIKEKIQFDLENSGLDYILEELRILDPEYYNKVDKNNVVRVTRALEVIKQTNFKFSSLRTNKKKEREFKSHILILESSRDDLYFKINTRVDKMLENGLEKEAYQLMDYKKLNTLNTVGYKEFFKYFDGELSYNDTISKIKQNTRNYAKRQITWLKKYKNAIRINSNSNANSIISKISNTHEKF
ncbi:MAG: tRNA (adenosine(37)-N6)-dimethylallyltransferase MiaA [Bacteroidota bacterium]